MDKSQLPFGPAYGFGIYFHWPYCARICPYCDFNVYAAKDRNTDDLLQALLADLTHQARTLQAHPPLTSVFFGGGTPSLMTPAQIEACLRTCEDLFRLAPSCEVTLEVNPNNLVDAQARAWQQAGVNRLSIGVQSLDDGALTFLGRDHSSAEARKAIDVATQHFPAVSLDMIYARPGQTLVDWENELTGILALNPSHLSLYELTIADGTAFARQAARGALTPLPDTQQADMYELTQQLTQSAGLPAYEISNHARADIDQSRHNTIYWRSGDWLGIGPGAHGRLTQDQTRLETLAVAKPQAYINAVRETGHGLASCVTLSDAEALQELITMGLRPAEGIEMTRVTDFSGAPDITARIGHLQDGGWIHPSSDRLMLAPKGRLLADRVALELLS